MERVKRNTEGLRQNAQKKREETFEKVEDAIRQLIKEKRRINFNTVVEVSGVSKAWLYKEPEIRTRIEQLRKQGGGGKQAPIKRQTSDPSKDALLKTFKERIKKLESENHDLRRQNEIASSYMLKVRQLEQQIKRLEAENERLREQAITQPVQNLVTITDSKPDLCSIRAKLEQLGFELNSTLEKLVKQYPQAIVESAINSLEEALSDNRVRNPYAFLHSAIIDAWQPNEQFQETQTRKLFNQWYDLAHLQRLVIGACLVDGTQYVILQSGEQVTFKEMYALKPLEVLQQEKAENY